MPRPACRAGAIFAALTAIMLLGGSASAQPAEKPRLYTYVAEWGVPRAMWADYQKQEAGNVEAMKKAVADGTLVAFGSYAVVNHQEGEATHGTWFSAASMANLMKVLEGLRSSPVSTSPVLAASKHRDFILRSENYNGHSGTFTNGYLRVGSWPSKVGASDPDGKIVKATMGALLEKLLAEGALHAYQLDEEAVHSGDPGTLYVAIVSNGAEGLDKFEAAIDEMGKSNPAALAGFGTLIDRHGHRDMLARVDTITHK
jgi:hypothetical protein